MSARARLRLCLLRAQALWTLVLLGVVLGVTAGAAWAEGRALEPRRWLEAAVPASACLGFCVAWARARAARVDVALGALGARWPTFLWPGLVVAWSLCLTGVASDVTPVKRRGSAAWRIEDTPTGRRLVHPGGVVVLRGETNGLHRDDLAESEARLPDAVLAPVDVESSAAARGWRGLAPGPALAVAGWALGALPTPPGVVMTLGAGVTTWLVLTLVSP
jgi:hypothetical protein